MAELDPPAPAWGASVGAPSPRSRPRDVAPGAVAAKTVAVVQSNYIPWKGYFDLIRGADEFILFDDVQYTRRDWRNRNRIKTSNGLLWLSIPVESKGRYFEAIKDMRVVDRHWAGNHWKSMASAYARAPYFGAYKEAF